MVLHLLIEINITQVGNAKDINVVISIYNFIEYNNNYWKTSGSLRQYCKDKPALIIINNFVGFNGDNNTDSFKVKTTGNDGTKNVEIAVPLKYWSKF